MPASSKDGGGLADAAGMPSSSSNGTLDVCHPEGNGYVAHVAPVNRDGYPPVLVHLSPCTTLSRLHTDPLPLTVALTAQQQRVSHRSSFLSWSPHSTYCSRCTDADKELPFSRVEFVRVVTQSLIDLGYKYVVGPSRHMNILCFISSRLFDRALIYVCDLLPYPHPSTSLTVTPPARWRKNQGSSCSPPLYLLSARA